MINEANPSHTMTANSAQSNFCEMESFLLIMCNRLSPDMAKHAANQEVVYVFVKVALWVLNEIEWPITPAIPDSRIAMESQVRAFFITLLLRKVEQEKVRHGECNGRPTVKLQLNEFECFRVGVSIVIRSAVG